MMAMVSIVLLLALLVVVLGRRLARVPLVAAIINGIERGDDALLGSGSGESLG